jgi:hypothetical protein
MGSPSLWWLISFAERIATKKKNNLADTSAATNAFSELVSPILPMKKDTT